MSESRSRSPSPQREERKAKKQKTDGFKWKDKKSKVENEVDERDSGKLERGYRNRSPRRDRDRDRERERDRSPRQGSDRHYGREERRETDSYRPQDRDRGQETDSRPARKSKDNAENDSTSVASKFGTKAAADSKSKSDKPKQPKKAAAPSEPMIIVNINDRLGTKAAIPCLASDSVKAFKAIVAAHIGRQPHEIMLKRQGERPFKDQLTLEDYGVSSGVQLDLELDTGD